MFKPKRYILDSWVINVATMVREKYYLSDKKTLNESLSSLNETNTK